MDNPLTFTVTHLPSKERRDEAAAATVGELLEAIRKGPTPEAIRCRELSFDPGKADELQDLKGNLSAATFSSLYSGPARKGAPHTFTGLLCLDVDKLPAEELTAHRERLQEDEHVLALFTSPSGKGLKVLVQAALPEVSPEEERRAFWHTYQQAAEALGLTPDPNAKDLERLCYLPHDPEAYVNEHAVPFPAVPLPPQPQRVAPPPRAYFSESSDELEGFTVEEVLREIDKDKDRRNPLDPGQRNSSTYARLAAYAENGIPKAEAVAHLQNLLSADHEHARDVPRQAEAAYSAVPFAGERWAVFRLMGERRRYSSHVAPFRNTEAMEEEQREPRLLRVWSLDELTEEARTIPPAKSTGWAKLDASVKLRPGGVCLVGAMPGGGKSVFLINLALQMARAYPGEVFYFFSAEMTAREVFFRMQQALSYTGEDRRRNVVGRGHGAYLSEGPELHVVDGPFAHGRKPKELGEYCAHDGELLAELHRMRSKGESLADLISRSPAHSEVLRHFVKGEAEVAELLTSGRVRIVDAPAQLILTEEVDRILQEARERGENLGGVFVDYATRVESEEAEHEGEYRLRVVTACRHLTRIAKDTAVPVVLAAQITRAAHSGRDKAGNVEHPTPTSHWEALGEPHIPHGDVFAEASHWFKDADVALLIGNPTQGEGGSKPELLEPYLAHGEVPLWVRVIKNRGGESNKLLRLGYVPHAQAIHEDLEAPPEVRVYTKEEAAAEQGPQTKKAKKSNSSGPSLQEMESRVRQQYAQEGKPIPPGWKPSPEELRAVSGN